MVTTVKWYGEKLIKEVGLKCFRRMEKACLFLEGDIKKSFKPGTGRRYRKGKGRWHTASAPGRPPAVDEGTMRDSITHEVEMHGKNIIGRVGSTIKKPNYPLFLEYGTSKMSARPWARVALQRNKKTLARILGAK